MHPIESFHFISIHLFSDGRGGGLGLEDLLDNFLFFNEEGTDDAVTDATGAAGTTVGTANVLGVLAQAVVFSGAKSRDLFNVERESR